MNDKSEKKMPKSACIAALFFALLIILSCCSKKSVLDESSAEASLSNQVAFETITKYIREKIKELGYPDFVGKDLVKMVHNWKCVLWKQKLDKTRQNFQEKKTTLDQVAHIEENLVKAIYQKIVEEISFSDDTRFFDLNMVIKDKKATCMGYSQLIYIIGNSIGLSFEIVDVIEPVSGSLPEGGHVACLVYLSDEKVLLVDLTYSFVSKAFALKEEFNKTDFYWELKDKSNHLGIHRRIRLLDKNELIADIYHGQGFECYKSGEYIEAISDFTKAIEFAPESSELYMGRGAVFIELGKYAEAISDYTKAIDQNPKYTEAYVGRGAVYGRLGQYTESILDHSKAIELNPKCTMAYNNRGIDYSELGKNTEALSDFSIAIKLNPENIEAFYSRGVVFYKLGRYLEAIDDYTKSIELKSSYSMAYYGRGLAYVALGKYQESIDDYTKAIEFNQYNADAYIGRGIADAILGNTKEAKEDLKKAVELNPALKEQVKMISDQYKLGI